MPPVRPPAGSPLQAAEVRDHECDGPLPWWGGNHLVVPPGVPVPARSTKGYVRRANGMKILIGFRNLDPDPTRSQAPVEAVRITRVAVWPSMAAREGVLRPAVRRPIGGLPPLAGEGPRLFDVRRPQPT